ncbi:SDR family NAD(P)-dependent oxidoreductase [bacterium]|nr:SDR family NAD(P)-dependent oxidoreductase [bacterium]
MKKQRVCITGAAGGLGKAFAKECAARGWDLYLTDLSPVKLDRLASGLSRLYPVSVQYAACNLTDPTEREAFWVKLSEQGYGPDWLINVAGLDFEGAFKNRSMQEITTIIRLNIEATVSMTRYMVETHVDGRPQHIVNVSSLAGFYPMPLKAVYAASKRFLLDFSRAMNQELRSEDIHVLALCPAGLATKTETIHSIESQGWIGQVTTMQTGSVVAQTINHARMGRSVFIPGWVNRVIRSVSAVLPSDWIAWVIRRRWEKTRALAAKYNLSDQVSLPVTGALAKST